MLGEGGKEGEVVGEGEGEKVNGEVGKADGGEEEKEGGSVFGFEERPMESPRMMAITARIGGR